LVKKDERMDQSIDLLTLPLTLKAQFVGDRRSVLEEPVSAVWMSLSEGGESVRGPRETRVDWEKGGCCVQQYRL
jgi:hypothetical protein